MRKFRGHLLAWASAIGLALFLAFGTQPGQAVAQVARAQTTTGVVYIRSILSGTLTGASGTAISFPTVTATSQFLAPTGCTSSALSYTFTGRITDGFCSSGAGVVKWYSGGINAGEFGANYFQVLGTNPTFYVGPDTRLYRSATKTVTFDDGAGGAATFAVTGGITASTNVSAATTGAFLFGALGGLKGSGTDGKLRLVDNSQGFQVEVNVGTAAPTVGTCGTGTIKANSRNTAGGFTATGATACTVTFATPAFTNTPHCIITPTKAPTTVPYISAESTTAFTVSGMTAGDNLTVDFHCLGGS